MDVLEFDLRLVERTIDYLEIKFVSSKLRSPLLQLAKFDSASWTGMLMSSSWENVQLGMIVCRFSSWSISKAKGLNCFVKISIEIFLVKFGWGVKMICLFDRIFIPHIHRKYRCPTTPPVLLLKFISPVLSKTLNPFLTTAFQLFDLWIPLRNF